MGYMRIRVSNIIMQAWGYKFWKELILSSAFFVTWELSSNQVFVDYMTLSWPKPNERKFKINK